MERFTVLDRIGEGTFGEVLKAKDLQLGRIVALKRVRLRDVDAGIPNNVSREIHALRLLEHPNIMHVYDVIPHGSSLVLVCEYMETDLHDVLARADELLSEAQIKSLMRMLLLALEHCHVHSVMHRDVKPSNMLLSSDGVLKLGDFGLARVHDESKASDYTHQVATRWYRAPELLFGARRYTPAVDMWATGCVMAELFNHAPLFPGENDIDQIFRVVQLMGAPNAEQWPEVTSLPDYRKISFPPLEAAPLEAAVTNASPLALDLIRRMLQYRPRARISASEALLHPFFLSEPLPVALPPSLLKRSAPDEAAGRRAEEQEAGGHDAGAAAALPDWLAAGMRDPVEFMDRELAAWMAGRRGMADEHNLCSACPAGEGAPAAADAPGGSPRPSSTTSEVAIWPRDHSRREGESGAAEERKH